MNQPVRNVLVAPWMGGVFGAEVIEGVHAELAARGLSWNIRFVDSASAFASTAFWMLEGGRLDGAITHYGASPAVDRLCAAGVPVIGLDFACEAPLPRHPRFVFVRPDYAAIATVVVEHFVSRVGFRSAGYVECHWDSGWSRRRGDAVEREFRRRGIRFSRFFHYGESSPRNPKEGPDFGALAEWLRALEKPAAVVAANDAMGVDVVQVCDATGIAVPRDVAVLGMDDDPAHCLHCRPNLSSVHFDGRRAGSLCVAAIAEMIHERGGAPRTPLLYGVSAIVRRASTGAVSTAGALVQKALDYIDANACRGISLADVARHLGVSRSLATQRFRELCGTSILDAIRARRVEEAKRLIGSSGKLLEDISAACGFRGGADWLGRTFRAATGLTPSQWREGMR